MTNMTMKYHFGIDGGGSGCRAILADAAGNVLGRGASGPANISADAENTILHIYEATERARENAGLSASIYKSANAVLGLAGANALSSHATLYKRLPFAKSKIVSDALTALEGAMGDGDGAIVILGTGSAFVQRIDDVIQIIGGRGFMLSDHAGGARLGRDLLEYTLLSSDGFEDSTDLSQAVLEKFEGDPRNITTFSRTANASDYASLAPLLFNFAAKRDPLAITLLTHACNMIRTGLEKMAIKEHKRFSITGGLAASYIALPCFPYREFYAEPRGDSLQGALALAMKGSSV